jgi:hypothetical protein
MKVVDPYGIKDIVNKHNLSNQVVHDMYVDDIFPVISGVLSDIIPVDLDRLRELRLVSVAPNTTVPSHAHRSPVVRLIIDGSVSIDGIEYVKGDWMIIPENHAYSLSTKSGYSACWVCVRC